MQPQVFLGIILGKTEHHATAVDRDGQVVHDKPLPQSEPKIQELLTALAAKHEQLLVVVDQPKTIGALVIAVAQQLGIAVAYLPGLTMRRVADLHPGQAKTDPRDAYIISRLAAQLAQLTEQRADIEAEILTVVDAHPRTCVLTSMPGIGVRTAARILTEVIGKKLQIRRTPSLIRQHRTSNPPIRNLHSR